MLRVALYRLQTPKIGPRWGWIWDHTAAFNGVKLLVICAVDLDMLDKRLADGSGNFSLCQRDVQPIAIKPMPHSTAELLLEVYDDCTAKYGTPEWMVNDGGSDICRCAQLIAATQVRDGLKPTRLIYDISHQIARIIQRELGSMLGWKTFEDLVSAARTYCKYKARHLSPPSLGHGPDRWMNLSGIIYWFCNMLGLLKLQGIASSSAMDHGDHGDNGVSIEAEVAAEVGVHKPRFGLTEVVRGQMRELYKKRGYKRKQSAFYKLEDVVGKIYPTEDAYAEILWQNCPQMPKAIHKFLLKNADLNTIYLNDVMANSHEVEEIHRQVKEMLAFTNKVQKYFKENGLTNNGGVICEAFYREGKLEGVGQQVGQKVVAAIRTMAEELRAGERVVASSDVIESLNGSWKMHINGAANPALGSNALIMPALMGEPSMEEAKLALESVSVADVQNWQTEIFGKTFHQEKRAASLKLRDKKNHQN